MIEYPELTYNLLGLSDLLFPIYLFFIYLLLNRYNKKKNIPLNQKYFLKGFFLKLLGSIVFILLNQYYFKYGDTFEYFTGTTNIYKVFQHNASYGLQMIFVDRENFSANISAICHPMFFYFAAPPYHILQIGGFLSLLTFNSYLNITLLISTITFIGLWNLYLLLNRYFPNKEKIFFLVCFCIPSLSIWASGLLKDSIAIGCLGILANHLDLLFKNREQYVKRIFIISISGYFIFLVKDYILYGYLCAFFIGLILTKIKNFNKIVRIITVVLFLLFILGVLTIYASLISDYVIEIVVQTAIEKQKTWAEYGAAVNSGSDFSLGEITPSIAGLMFLVPKTINVTLFRPYLWECTSLIMVFDSLQSVFCILLFIRAIIITRFFYFFKLIFSDRLLITFFLFVIIFAFFVGLNTANFGSLSRYKVPLLPFFISLLIIVPTLYKKTK